MNTTPKRTGFIIWPTAGEVTAAGRSEPLIVGGIAIRSITGGFQFSDPPTVVFRDCEVIESSESDQRDEEST